ncbi:MAG: hypothetical protein JNJ40_03805 [Bacteroidia bacterium]|nr:hypothetical protein [Bacteroidia bacterium]
MIKSQRLLLSLLAIIIIASSCSSKFSVSKRRYTKGYHVSFAKNSKTSKVKVDNNTKNEVAVLKENKTNNEIDPIALADNKENVYDAKTSFNRPVKVTKKKPAKVFNNRYLSIANNATNTKNVINTLIEKKQEQLHAYTSKSKQKVKAPFDLLGGGIGSILLYVFASIVGTILIYAFLFLMLALLSGAVVPSWLIGILIAIGLLIVIGIIVVVVINGD